MGKISKNQKKPSEFQHSYHFTPLLRFNNLEPNTNYTITLGDYNALTFVTQLQALGDGTALSVVWDEKEKVSRVSWEDMIDAENGYGVSIISTDSDSKNLLKEIGLQEGEEIEVNSNFFELKSKGLVRYLCVSIVGFGKYQISVPSIKCFLTECSDESCERYFQAELEIEENSDFELKTHLEVRVDLNELPGSAVSLNCLSTESMIFGLQNTSDIDSSQTGNIVTITQDFQNSKPSSNYNLSVTIRCETFVIFKFDIFKFYTLPLSPDAYLLNITDSSMKFLLTTTQNDKLLANQQLANQQLTEPAIVSWESYKIGGQLKNLEKPDEVTIGSCKVAAEDLNVTIQFGELEAFTSYSVEFRIFHELNGVIENGVQFRYRGVLVDEIHGVDSEIGKLVGNGEDGNEMLQRCGEYREISGFANFNLNMIK